MKPFTTYVCAHPLGCRLFWYTDELGVVRCVADIHELKSPLVPKGIVERDGVEVEMLGVHMTMEERIRRVIIHAYEHLSDKESENKVELTTDQIEAARLALKGLGLALGLKQKEKQG